MSKVLFKHWCPCCMSVTVKNDTNLLPTHLKATQGHGGAGQPLWFTSSTQSRFHFFYLNCWWLFQNSLSFHTIGLRKATSRTTSDLWWWLQSINGNWGCKDSVEEISWQTQTTMQIIWGDIIAFHGVEKVFEECEDQIVLKLHCFRHVFKCMYHTLEIIRTKCKLSDC